MIIEYTVLVVSFLALGLLTKYVVWVKVREIFVRQDLFIIRDRLWDQAELLGGLNDPAYREVRRKMNSLIMGAPYVSLPMLHKARCLWKDHPAKSRPRSESKDMEQLLKNAEKATRKRIREYLTRDRCFSYWSWLFFVGGTQMADRLFSQWTESNGPRELAQLAHFEQNQATTA